jgi:hypothetical protein
MRFLVSLSMVVPSVAVRVPAAPAPLAAPALTPALSAPSLQASPIKPAPTAVSAPTPVADDREAALVQKLSADLCSSNCVDRRKKAAWIAELAASHPREAVQTAAVRGLASDAASANDLLYFEHVTGLIQSFASSTPHEAVFDAAVGSLVDAARESGRAQRREALAAVVRMSSGASPERRARASAALETLRGQTAFTLDADYLEGAIARVRR